MLLTKTLLTKIFPGLVALGLACAALPAGAAARQLAQAPTVMRTPALVTPTDFSASRRHFHRMRQATRVHIHRRSDYSFFEPYAPPVPLFFPFGYRQGYF
jgi:hypothetical protein